MLGPAQILYKIGAHIHLLIWPSMHAKVEAEIIGSAKES
jgi:hypothetical protein